MALTNSEEKYVLVIYKQHEMRIAQNTKEFCTINTNDIAAELGVRPASVTEMLQRLDKKKILIYQKNQGVILTESGRLIALHIKRKQMLWEYFLSDKLKLPLTDAFFISANLRCVESVCLFEKLSDFLGNPLYGVNGEAIPTVDGKMDHAFGVALGSLGKDFSGKIVSLKENNINFLEFLSKRGVGINTEIKILDICLFDQSIEIKVLTTGSVLTISKKIADAIIVSK